MLAERRPRGRLAHNQPHSPPAVRCGGVRSVRRNASPVKAVEPCRGWNKTSLRACQPFSLRWLVNRKRHGDSFWPGSFILIQSIQSMSIVVTSCTASIPSLQLDYHFEISINKKTNKRGIHFVRETHFFNTPSVGLNKKKVGGLNPFRCPWFHHPTQQRSRCSAKRSAQKRRNHVDALCLIFRPWGAGCMGHAQYFCSTVGQRFIITKRIATNLTSICTTENLWSTCFDWVLCVWFCCISAYSSSLHSLPKL